MFTIYKPPSPAIKNLCIYMMTIDYSILVGKRRKDRVDIMAVAALVTFHLPPIRKIRLVRNC